MMSTHAVAILFLLIGCCAADLASPRSTVGQRYNFGPRHYKRFHENGTTRSRNYRNHYELPVLHYDHGASNRLDDQRTTGRRYPTKDYSRDEGTAPFTTGIYRTYGRGSALVPRPGATIIVSNMVKPKVHKGTITATIRDTPERSSRTHGTRRARRDCIRCPYNRAVVASKGHSRVILPEPCPTTRWVSMIGPYPGAKLGEGTHNLVGRLGNSGKICRYQYEVVVRHCGELKIDGGSTNCTAGDAWGSICNVTCATGRELVGDPRMECRDDLTWSPAPTCKNKIGCPLPKTPDDTKIWCQVPNETDLVADRLPPKTYCRFQSEEGQRIITCIDGYWVIKRRGSLRRRNLSLKRRRYQQELKKWQERNVVPREDRHD